MLNRRSLLIGLGTLAVGQLLGGCGQREPSFRVRLLEGSVPAEILREFQRRIAQSDQSLDFLPSAQLADLFTLLQSWQEKSQSGEKPQSGFSIPLPFGNQAKSSPVADVVTLGDNWLAPAIQQGLIQPFQVEQFANWQQVPSLWQQLVRRDRQGQPSAEGEIWAAPYRWGTLVIAYNVEKFKTLGWTPTDWSDLWRPELKGFVSVLDSPRSVIGLTLKKLGLSVNTANLDEVANLPAELESLQAQLKFYSSNAYLQPLMLRDTWVAVGWSTEVLPVIERDRRIAAVVPKSGTILTADLWVRPTQAPAASSTEPSSDGLTLLQQWIEFCWQLPVATQLSALSLAASPVLVAADRAQLPASIQQNSVLLPDPKVLEASEFLLPLSPTSVEQYRRLWTTVRQRA